MKVLVLSLFSKTNIYEEMQIIQKQYIHTIPDIDAYFITFKEDMSENEHVQLIDDTIYIKGKESYTNILYKTIISLHYLINALGKRYDYVIRTNISTVIHYNNLIQYLTTLPLTNVYIGGKVEELKWLLQPYEISENKQEQRNSYYGLKYIQGNGIILSFDVVTKLLEYSSFFEYDIVDDVKLGIIIRDYLPNVYENINKLALGNVSYNALSIYDHKDAVFFRNRTSNRMLDIHTIRNIVYQLYNIKYLNYKHVIHLTYKNVEALEPIKKQWIELNPTYRVELYDDARCLSFLQEHYGKKYCDIFQFIPDGAIKCDFFRICVLYICGGVYTDADIQPMVPLRDYIDDDVEFATCLSYNYSASNQRFNYNPHFIVTKQGNPFLYKTMKKYETYYDNKTPYSYWGWSICSLFNIDLSLNVTLDTNMTVIDGKKYQFLIETAIDNNIEYNYTNIRDENRALKIQYASTCVCKYNGIVVLNNSSNKKYF